MQAHEVVKDVREASRRLVRELGFMRPTLAETELSPSGVHALIEIGGSDALSPSELSKRLGLEKSSVSRLVARLVERGEVSMRVDKADGRGKVLTLTREGRATLAAIDRFANRRVSGALAKVTNPAAVRDSLAGYARALAGERQMSSVAIEAGYRPGIVGRCTTMHARYYAREHGLGAQFETNVAAEFAEFVGRLGNPANECWSAIVNGEVVGTIVMDDDDMGPDFMRLRWFVIDDGARGLGIGHKLLGAALAHADRLKRPVRLRTFRGLDSARHLYEQTGFRLIAEKPKSLWGSEVMDQLFERPAA
ncbi:MarR family protein [Variibacter gotjawalensis]|uniref:MarR family protein n=1 Tax=Variibacter gotjawalensis TaxID=1333996 RepID=A0A0S3PXT9_9BRAD|nr:bifunctional helix-turn-helix transcriptional regulator/GNAT family N-acetyltransferase [Variibacter gotjawalensis]NIK46604.1 DNA-binding MarR family transcriptional regulator/GNAT superfamily N-acetyltransferase [Variibacter gotjawalensis]RZS48507.1 MarR family transcriptional regulator with acetyltransferase activity [Variibacter gotjawalensis]BAT60769.1 MarR family protein [Variibacter gotjawalensis]